MNDLNYRSIYLAHQICFSWASSHAYTAIGANLKLIKGDFVKVYSNDDIACAEFVRDIRLGRIMFDSIDTTNSILHSVCCD